MVAVAVVALVVALAMPDISAHLGAYRLNGAARDLEAEVEACRLRAITENREFALQFLQTDGAPPDARSIRGGGAYRVMIGDSSVASTSWDVLPEGEGEREGTRDLAKGPGRWRGVGLESWTPLRGPLERPLPDTLVFGPSGFLLNPGTDLPGGEARVVLRGPTADGALQRRVVLIAPDGTARIARPAP